MNTSHINITHEGKVFAGFALSDLPLPAAVAAACEKIDQVADAARLAVVGDPLRAVEYQQAAIEAQAFQTAGYKGDVPPTVATWAEAKSITAKASAESILVEAAAWNSVLYAIRDARLKGKEAVKKSENHDEAEAAADIAIDSIRGVIAGVGNA